VVRVHVINNHGHGTQLKMGWHESFGDVFKYLVV
jgi:hypothetical protein